MKSKFQPENSDLPIYTLNVSSKFKSEPGLKSTEKIKEFKQVVITNEVK